MKIHILPKAIYKKFIHKFLKKFFLCRFQPNDQCKSLILSFSSNITILLWKRFSRLSLLYTIKVIKILYDFVDYLLLEQMDICDVIWSRCIIKRADEPLDLMSEIKSSSVLGLSDHILVIHITQLIILYII